MASTSAVKVDELTTRGMECPDVFRRQRFEDGIRFTVL